MLTEAGKSLYKDAKYIIQYCKESVERAKKAMQEKDNVIRIGTSPMTPAAPLVQIWSRVQKDYPDIKLHMVPYMNSLENAREILKNLGQNIDVVAGIFDETMLNSGSAPAWSCPGSGSAARCRSITVWQKRRSLRTRICTGRISL